MSNLVEVLGCEFVALPIEDTVGCFDDLMREEEPVQVYTEATGFVSVADEVTWQEYAIRRPEIALGTRKDPFLPGNLYGAMVTRKMSVHLGRNIETFADACSNALGVVRAWYNEDMKKANRALEREHILRNQEEVDRLAAEWRAAVAQRKEAITGWDAYVAAKRKAYQDSKKPGATPVAETPVLG